MNDSERNNETSAKRNINVKMGFIRHAAPHNTLSHIPSHRVWNSMKKR